MRRLELMKRLAGGRWVLSAVVLAGVLVSAPWVVWALELDEPTLKDRMIAKKIAMDMGHLHLTGRDIDDEISKRGLELLLKSLDPSKLYFYESDIEEFRKFNTSLDDLVSDGDVTPAFLIFNRLLQRIDERLVVIHQLIEADHDFTVDEEMVIDADKLTYPADAEEAKDRWRKRIKYGLLVLKSEETVGDEAKERLHRRYNAFARRMDQFDGEEVIEMFVTALTNAYDPHSSYMSGTTYENFNIQMSLKLEGIGASLQSEDGITVVKRIVPGGAADKHGKLKVEDRIVSVGQEDSDEMVDVTDMKLDDVVKQIRGEAGSVVKLGVMPAGSNEIKTYSIVREKIELKDSEAHGEIMTQGTKQDGTPNRIGVIELPSFYRDMDGARSGLLDFRSTTRDVRRILEEFKSEGVDGVVLDLRANGGGSLDEAITCTGLFIDRGPVVQVKSFDGSSQAYDDRESGAVWDGPLVVLTSKFSASASEILAGAIQDYDRGLIVGDTATHGKGTVQSLLPVSRILFGPTQLGDQWGRYGALKVTMQQFYRPSGDSTQKRGVLADVVLPSISDHMDVGESDLEYALEFDKIAEAKHEDLDLVSPALKEKLQSMSKARVDKSSDFADLQKDIKRYVEQKDRETVTLNEEKFFEQRKEFDADKQDEELIDQQVNGDSTKIDRDYYLDEVLAITADYIELVKLDTVARN